MLEFLNNMMASIFVFFMFFIAFVFSFLIVGGAVYLAVQLFNWFGVIACG